MEKPQDYFERAKEQKLCVEAIYKEVEKALSPVLRKRIDNICQEISKLSSDLCSVSDREDKRKTIDVHHSIIDNPRYVTLRGLASK